MKVDECRDAARQLIDTLPVIMQSVASAMRRGDDPMPIPHFGALMVLAHRGPCTLTGLAERQRVSLPTMSNTVSLLVDRGWAERVADANDRRRAEVRLTAEGSDAVRRMHVQVEDLLVDRLCDLPLAELDELKAGLAVLRRAFGAHGAHAGGGDAA